MSDNKMTPAEAGDKGAAILEHIVEIYSLIDWNPADEAGDPFIKVTFYKSGKFTLENYQDGDISEFNIDDAKE